MPIDFKLRIIITIIVYLVAIAFWIYAVLKIPRKFLVQDTVVGFFLIVGVFVILEIIIRHYQESFWNTFVEWPEIWPALIALGLVGGTIKRYMKRKRREKQDTLS